ncbi:MAG: hypothetical protein CM15mP83_1230 [Flavobacteriaceae bacterium]|nr:MAG: hypothetical protein CM15mP83_1230 [Flavobacteriaceae bacterium]
MQSPPHKGTTLFDISEEDRDLFELIDQILSVEVDDQERSSFY